MAFKTYYTLKSENSLPLNTYFVDPYSGDKYAPQPGDTLDTFASRINEELKAKESPTYLTSEFKPMIITALVESVRDDATLDKYFVQRAIAPTFQELVTYSRTLFAQIIKAGHAPFKQRQERADICLANTCTMHSRKSAISQAALNLASKLLSVDTLMNSEKEQALGTCGMCGCGMKAKNKLPITNILAGLAPGDLAKLLTRHRERAFDRCWILQEAMRTPNNRRLLEAKLKNAPQDQSQYLHIYEQQKDLRKE